MTIATQTIVTEECGNEPGIHNYIVFAKQPTEEDSCSPLVLLAHTQNSLFCVLKQVATDTISTRTAFPIILG
jgi:hypothetical protein